MKFPAKIFERTVTLNVREKGRLITEKHRKSCAESDNVDRKNCEKVEKS